MVTKTILTTGALTAITVIFMYAWTKSRKKKNSLTDDSKNISSPQTEGHDSLCEIEKMGAVHNSLETIQLVEDEHGISESSHQRPTSLPESARIENINNDLEVLKLALSSPNGDSEEDSGFQKKSFSSNTESLLSKDGEDFEDNDISSNPEIDSSSVTPPAEEERNDLEAEQTPSDSENVAKECVNFVLSENQVVVSPQNVTQPSDIAEPPDRPFSTSWADIEDNDTMEFVDENGMRRIVHFFDSKDLPENFGAHNGESSDNVNDNGLSENANPGDVIFTRCVPQQYCGLIFGRNGRNAKELRDKYGCRLQLTREHYDIMSQNLHFICPEKYVNEVEKWFRHKMRICQTLACNSGTNVSNPSKLLKNLPLNELVPVFVIGMESTTELYVQIYNPEELEEFERFQAALDEHYLTQDCPHLPSPVGRGAICIAPYLDGHYYRVRILNQTVMPDGDTLVTVFYLDFGGQLNHSISSLYKIKEEFMRFPFQAVLVRWAHAEPLNADAGDTYAQYFQNRSLYAHTVLRDDLNIDHAVFFASTGAPNQLFDVLQEAHGAGHYNIACYDHCHLKTGKKSSINKNAIECSNEDDCPIYDSYHVPYYYAPKIGTLDYVSFVASYPSDTNSKKQFPYRDKSKPRGRGFGDNHRQYSSRYESQPRRQFVRQSAHHESKTRSKCNSSASR